MTPNGCAYLVQPSRIPYSIEAHLWPVLRKKGDKLMDWNGDEGVWQIKPRYDQAIKDILKSTEVGYPYSDKGAYWKPDSGPGGAFTAREMQFRLRSFRRLDHRWLVSETPYPLRQRNGLAALMSNQMLAPIKVADSLIVPQGC
jgi:hypothetical protein